MLTVASSMIGPPSRVPAIQVRVEAPTCADARFCFRQYFQELSERFDGGFDPERSNPARDEDMTSPAGIFVMARLDGWPAGCGVLKIGDGAIGEIKRMWTAPSARGKGVARAVLRKLEPALITASCARHQPPHSPALARLQTRSSARSTRWTPKSQNGSIMPNSQHKNLTHSHQQL